MAARDKTLLYRILAALKRKAGPGRKTEPDPGHPDDPYASFRQQKKPRPPLRGAAVALEEPKS